jgi:gliding motility-associated-like protein
MKSFCQPLSCPENIGFELGSFTNWDAFAGRINASGVVTVTPTQPLSTRHTLLQNTYPQLKDPYGDFPVNCPNGSGYSIQLGNSATGSEAEQLSYTFKIPDNQDNYSIIYNYAVVLQNPNHQDYQQPKFNSKVFDVTSGQYVQCGSFEFVASANLPGFQLSKVGTNIYYKPWSPITINLYGYAGKTIRIEFTNNDCTLGGHFGYAYLDVNENCSSPISGNTYCNGANSLTLTAPFGFQEYRWYTADFSRVLGTENILKITPPPPPNTSYVLEIVPFPGLGCLDTLSTTVQLSPEGFNLNVIDSIVGCVSTGVDLTAKMVTDGSTPNLTYSYFLDANQREYLATPKVVTSSGTYYIKAVNATGCNDMKPVKVIITDPPNIVVKNPQPACTPNTVDLTSPLVTAGSAAGLNYSYWKDAAATSILPNPDAVTSNGTYYIKGTFAGGCSKTVPVTVTIGTVPRLVINNPTACGKVDLKATGVTRGSDIGLTYSYWIDSATSVSLPEANAVTSNGNYYIKATSSLGCSAVKPVEATVNSVPVFTVTSPIVVTYPATADLPSSVSPRAGLNYSFWKDQQATVLLPRPNAIDINGTFYIKATNENGCSINQSVTVVIDAPPDPKITAPTAFSPNKDGINDLFKISIAGEARVKAIRIYNRWGQVVFEANTINDYWDGSAKGKELPVGTYYWVFEGTDRYKEKKMTSSGSVTLIR